MTIKPNQEYSCKKNHTYMGAEFKKGKKYNTRIVTTNLVTILGDNKRICVYAVSRKLSLDYVPYFFDCFYTEKEERIKKLTKLKYL